MKSVASSVPTSFSRCILVALAMVVLMWGCEFAGSGKEKETPRTKVSSKESPEAGRINIGIDITMQPVIQQLVDAFHIENPKAELNAIYATEDELVKGLQQDSMRLIILSRELTAPETAVLRKQQSRTTVTQIASDAIVAILHPENPMDSLTMEALGKVVRGEAYTWRQIGGDSDDPVNLVFDAPTSSTVRMIRERFLKPEQALPKNAFEATSQEKVVEYVSQDKNAIGFIGYCQVSDRDSRAVQAVLEKIKLARLDATDTSDVSGFFIRPYQNEIALGRYPLSRPVIIVSREHFLGLGTGFANYSAGEIGQRILLKAGLVPKSMPPRLIVLPEKED
ncbi:MAG: substrate-binding domain-containing protein [Bacteroidetes bacterium]|nr:substrate-binding domain-containing protein [Bacteroidota bacterium]